MIRNLRNLIGRIRGFGRCLKCGDRWNWKEPHFIVFEGEGMEESSMFPLCDECFWKLPIEGTQGIMHFCNELLTLWIAFGRREFPPDRVSRMLKAMRTNIQKEMFDRDVDLSCKL